MTRPRIALGGGSRSWKVVAPPDILRHLLNVEIVPSLAVAVAVAVAAPVAAPVAVAVSVPSTTD